MSLAFSSFTILFQVLGSCKNPNNKLISLNLTGNSIGDVGGTALAEVVLTSCNLRLTS